MGNIPSSGDTCADVICQCGVASQEGKESETDIENISPKLEYDSDFNSFYDINKEMRLSMVLDLNGATSGSGVDAKEFQPNIPFKTQIAQLAPYLPLHIIDYINNAAPSFHTRVFQGAVLFVDICGFTHISERFTREGSAACERFLDEANSYLTQILDIVTLYHGDVECFAGDSIMIIFEQDRIAHCSEVKKQPEDFGAGGFDPSVAPLKAACVLALKCAEQLIGRLSPFVTDGLEDVQLALHGAIGVGQMVSVVAGGSTLGLLQCWRSFVCGPVMGQIALSLDQSEKHEIVVSKEVMELVPDLAASVTMRSHGCGKLNLKTAEQNNSSPMSGGTSPIEKGSEKIGRRLSGTHPRLVLHKKQSTEFLGQYSSVWESKPELKDARLSFQSCRQSILDSCGQTEGSRKGSSKSMVMKMPPLQGLSPAKKEKDLSTDESTIPRQPASKTLGLLKHCSYFSLQHWHKGVLKSCMGAKPNKALPESVPSVTVGTASRYSVATEGTSFADVRRYQTYSNNPSPQHPQLNVRVDHSLKSVQDLNESLETMSYAEITCYLDRLQRFVPRPVIRQIAAGQSFWQGELRAVTVAFVNFQVAGLAETQLPNDALLLNLNAAIQRCLSIIYKYSGFIRQLTMDDKGLVLIYAFGSPGASFNNNTLRALTVAIEIRQSVWYHENIDLRVGVATGEACCGVIGTPSLRCEYSIFGDAVNLAARLSAAACKDPSNADTLHPVLCCPRTCAGIQKSKGGRALRLQEAFKILPKGKTEELVLYSVSCQPNEPDCVTDFATAGEDSEVQGSNLLGREFELATLQQVLSGDENCSTICCVVEGEEGVGKTSLLRRYVQASLHESFVLRTSIVDKYTPYFTVGQIFKVFLSEMVCETPVPTVAMLSPRATTRKMLTTDRPSNCSSPSVQRSECEQNNTTPESLPLAKRSARSSSLSMGTETVSTKVHSLLRQRFESCSRSFSENCSRSASPFRTIASASALQDGLKTLVRLLPSSQRRYLHLLKAFGIRRSDLSPTPSHLAALDQETDPSSSMQHLKELTVAIITTILKNRQVQANVSIILLDVQHIDIYSFEVLIHVLENCRTGITLLCSSVPPYGIMNNSVKQMYKRLLSLDLSHKIRVMQLSAKAVRLLCCQMLGVDDIEESCFKMIYKTCGGNPMFIKEFLTENKMVCCTSKNGRRVAEERRCCTESLPNVKLQKQASCQENTTDKYSVLSQRKRRSYTEISRLFSRRTSFIRRDSALRTRQYVSSDTLPAEMQAIATAKIDMLDPHLALALKVAAVIGEKFSLEELACVYPVPKHTLELSQYLELLCARNFLQCLKADTFIFRHNYIYHTAYNMLLHNYRRKLHRMIAIIMEEKSPTALPKIIRHWREVVNSLPSQEEIDELGGEEAWVDCLYRTMEAVVKASTYYISLGITDESLELLRWATFLLEDQLPPSFSRDKVELDLCCAALEVLSLLGTSDEEKRHFKNRVKELAKLPHLATESNKVASALTMKDLGSVRKSPDGSRARSRNLQTQNSGDLNDQLSVLNDVFLFCDSKTSPMKVATHAFQHMVSGNFVKKTNSDAIASLIFQGLKAVLSAVNGDLIRYSESIEIFTNKVSFLIADGMGSQVAAPLAQMLLFLIGVHEFDFSITLLKIIQNDADSSFLFQLKTSKKTKKTLRYIALALQIYKEITNVHNGLSDSVQSYVEEQLDQIYKTACRKCSKAHFSSAFKLASLAGNYPMAEKLLRKWENKTSKVSTMFDILLSLSSCVFTLDSNFCSPEEKTISGEENASTIKCAKAVQTMFSSLKEVQEKSLRLFETQICIILSNLLLGFSEVHKAHRLMSLIIGRIPDLPALFKKQRTWSLQFGTYLEAWKLWKLTKTLSDQRHLSPSQNGTFQNEHLSTHDQLDCLFLSCMVTENISLPENSLNHDNSSNYFSNTSIFTNKIRQSFISLTSPSSVAEKQNLNGDIVNRSSSPFNQKKSSRRSSASTTTSLNENDRLDCWNRKASISFTEIIMKTVPI